MQRSNVIIERPWRVSKDEARASRAPNFPKYRASWFETAFGLLTMRV
jgi:hypothetical protein